MSWIVLTVIGLLLFFAAPLFATRLPGKAGVAAAAGGALLPRIIGVGLALFGFLSTSFVTIDSDQVGHLKRIYLGKSMPPGRIIALGGENGPQAEVLAPGFHFRPFINVLYDVEMMPVVEVPAGKYGVLSARDGVALDKSQFVARGWPDASAEQMLNAEYFLTNGGQKGPQLTVLKPGKYRLNRYLFDLGLADALDVPAGHVAVIKSNVAERNDCPSQEAELARDGSEGLSVPLVPQGCIGVWNTPLLPNRYYLNKLAYSATLIPTQVQTWNYKGGYVQRQIHVSVGHDGSIEQREAEPIDVPVPQGAADAAVTLTVEGWRVPLELRALVQVEPANAPRVVASVGDLTAVEDKIISPAIRSVVRNETARGSDVARGIEGVRVLDLINRRAELEQAVERAIIPEGSKAGVTIKELRFGDPIIPPELLIATQRKQLAEQLRVTYAEEKRAQEERVNTEKARATADQQSELVKSEIAVQVADQMKQKLQKEGEGEKMRLSEIAAGQRAQADVLGQDRVLQLAMLKEILAAARENPDIVKVPTVLVGGSDGGGLAGAAAVLGASNLLQALQSPAVQGGQNRTPAAADGNTRQP